MLLQENSPLAYAIQHKKAELIELFFLQSLDEYLEIKTQAKLKKLSPF